MENKRSKKPTRERILEAIITYIETNGYSPTVREIREMVGLRSTSTVHGHLVRLEKKGKIVRVSDIPRAIRVVGHKYGAGRSVELNHDFEVIETLGMLSDHLDERLREINKVRCFSGEVRFDIRTFAADYICEDEGITLTASEISRLRDLLNAMGNLN